MSTQLERELIKELVRRVTYEELTNENLEEIKKIVEELEKSDYKQAIKNEILKCLGVDTSKYRVTASISTIVNSLIYLRLIGVGDVEKVVKQFPIVLGYSVERMQKIVEYLQRIGVKNIGKVVEKSPYIFAYSVDRMPKVVNYLKKIGVRDVGKLIEKSPRILRYSIEKMQEKLKYLQSIGIENVGKVVEKAPQIFGYSIDRMQKIVKCLERMGIRNVSEVIEKNPSIFGLSEETIQRKYKYLVEEIGLRAEDIEKYPILLSLSLERKIIPRLERLKSLGIYSEKDKIPSYLVLSKKLFEQVTESYSERMKLQIKRHISEEIVKCLSDAILGERLKQIEKCIESKLTVKERLIIDRFYKGSLRSLLVSALSDLRKAGKVYYEKRGRRWYLMEKRKEYEKIQEEFLKRYEEGY